MTGEMRRTRTHENARRVGRVVFIFAVTLSISFRAAPLSAHVPWPLVKEAEDAVWGSLMEIHEGVEDRLLVISTAHRAKGSGVLRRTLRLLDRAGRLPEGAALAPGDTGLFLYHPGPDLHGEFAPVDGWLLANGFQPMTPSASERQQLVELLAKDPDKETAEPQSAIDLLESENAACRALALGWLSHRPMKLQTSLQAPLAGAFGRERDAENQRAFLELFLLREWPLAGDAPAGFLIDSDDPTLVELATLYLVQNRGEVSVRSRLLEEYPRAPAHRRPRLLEAFGRIGLPEAYPWWREALLSGSAPEFRAALTGLALSGLPEAEEIHIALLESENAGIRRLALRGLATLATPRAVAALRDLAQAAPRADPLGALARRLLKHPFRDGTPRARFSTRRER